ncbi:hypothetical protein GCM10010174_00240 [Kutzneria viridogrisea]
MNPPPQAAHAVVVQNEVTLLGYQVSMLAGRSNGETGNHVRRPVLPLSVRFVGPWSTRRPAYLHALDKLVADGVAVKTQDKPRRFALAPAEATAAPAPTN